MEYWTVMWITVLSGGVVEGSETGLVYPSLEACEAAIIPVTDTLQYDFNVICEETGALSASIRPKRRPEGLTE